MYNKDNILGLKFTPKEESKDNVYTLSKFIDNDNILLTWEHGVSSNKTVDYSISKVIKLLNEKDWVVVGNAKPEFIFSL